MQLDASHHDIAGTHEEFCGTPSPSWTDKVEMGKTVQNWKHKHPNRNLALTSIVIPVYFHIIQQTSYTGALSKESIETKLMPTLNKAFSSSPFHFQLKDVDFAIYPSISECTNNNDHLFMKDLHAGHRGTLNVYLCNQVSLNGQTVAGYSNFPSGLEVYGHLALDGVVMRNPETDGYYLGKAYTLVHEGKLAMHFR